MKIIQPHVKIPAHEMDPAKVARIEEYARVCYQSAPKGNIGDLLESLLRSGHQSPLEHEKVTVYITCDRGVSHELVRHRIASYSQESTRYCNYSKDRFGDEIKIIEPFFFVDKDYRYSTWLNACSEAESSYMRLLEQGATAQEARSVLPNSLATEIVATFNMREWRLVFGLRAAKPAHPQMKQIMIPLYHYFAKTWPVLFSGIQIDETFPVQHYAKIWLVRK